MANYKFCKLSESVSKVYMKGIENCSLHISTTNSKLGFIPSFNLLPGITCSKESCTHCLREGCYAVKNAFRCGYNVDKNSTLKAWCDDGIEERIPENAMLCPGNCETCGMCWYLNELKRDTKFIKH